MEVTTIAIQNIIPNPLFYPPSRGLRPSSTHSPLPDIGREKLLTYDIGETVAEGNYALVKQCRSLATGEQLLLKMIKRAHTFGYEDIVCNEAAVMRNLCHKNILHLLDDWETDDYIWMLMPSFNVRELSWTHMHTHSIHTSLTESL